MDKRYQLLLMATAMVMCKPVAAADKFMCDQAAKFGYSDTLCQKPEQLKVITPGQIEADQIDAIQAQSLLGETARTRAQAEAQANLNQQSDFVARRAWTTPRAFNSLSPSFVYPGYSFNDNSAFDLRFSLRLRSPAPSTSGTRDRIKAGH